MKIALCQTAPTIGDFKGNQKKVLDILNHLAGKDVDIAVFPELTVCGYPPLDLLDRPAFWDANEAAVQFIADESKKIKNGPKAIAIGAVTRNAKLEGRPIYNSALVISDGKVVFQQSKRLLPTYDVFDEARYFQAETKSQLWDSPWGKVGICICEDSWFEETHKGRKIYAADPASDLKGADLAINLSASPFEMNKRQKRLQMLSDFAKRVDAPLIYVNQTGGNDEILFDGSSFVAAKNGSILFEMPDFKEACEVVELDLKDGKIKNTTAPSEQPQESIALLYQALVVGIKDYFQKTGFSKAVLGLSGGIDSAVIGVLATHALGKENVVGVSLPSQYSSSHSLSDADALARNLGIEYRVHSIKFMFSALTMELKPSFIGLPNDVTEENIQARLRAVALMAIANKRRALVLTTGNKSELAVGYCTSYGDMAGALGPIGDVYKTRVYELARYINTRFKGVIPESSITKPPSAELRPNQTDQDSLPAYEKLDFILESYFEGGIDPKPLEKLCKEKGILSEDLEKVMGLVRHSEFKRRQAAPVLKVSSKAFGIGRRIPIAKGF